MPSQRKIIFTGEAGQLEGMLHLPDGVPRAIAVVAHPLPIMGGTMDNKVVTTLVRTFVESGFATLRFNFRGVGESAGSYDEGSGETRDAIAAANFMRREFPDLPLICAGFSFGGYVQARAATELQPQQLVLIAPAVGRFAMPDVPANTLLIHGDLDEVVELREVLHWARPQHLPVIVLAGAEHFFHGRLTQLKQIVLQHFERRV
ncbi:MAG: alpha/beta hydrolase [Gallionella sp.]|nr:MAG: alpha/beta hydrolase [Gallionella sp.]